MINKKISGTILKVLNLVIFGSMMFTVYWLYRIKSVSLANDILLATGIYLIITKLSNIERKLRGKE